MLVQDADTALDEREAMDVVSEAQPDEQAWGDLLLAWRAVKHVASNAIVVARELATIGIGSGQMSRVDAVAHRDREGREHGHELAGSALASDAFFPFADGPQLALDAGVMAIIQPGGSKRDEDVIAAVDEPGRRWSSPIAATSATSRLRGRSGERRSRRRSRSRQPSARAEKRSST